MDKLLFTPGPLTTSKTVKEAMLRDLGSRDTSFVKIVADIREMLLDAGSVSKAAGYETVIMQGSGTFGIEAVISSAVPKAGKLLVIVNGAYGERIVKIAAVHRIPCEALVSSENEIPDIQKAEEHIKKGSFTHLAIIHCETTSGIFNPIEAFGELAAKHNLVYIVDSMSAFGAVPVDISKCRIDFLISSSNKCIEGVPGFSFVIARREELEKCRDNADTLTLDLYAQWAGLEKDGQFRFTPPTHALLAFWQALQELKTEGGVAARSARYQNNFNVLSEGMNQLGFTEYLPKEKQGYIIQSYLYPESSNFNFTTFYNKLNDLGYVIYPGKLTKANCFRIGNIGQIYPEQVKGLLAAIQAVKTEMGF